MHGKPIIFLLVLSLFVTAVQSNGSYTDVSVLEAKAMIDSDPSLVVLDVRTQSEYDEGHIGNARLIPHTELEGRLDELNLTDTILVYCGTGGRSATASQILVDNGFLHVYNMLEGITGWINAGYPVYVKYSSIQEAINSAAQGDTIFVSSGLYYEHLTVNKSLALVGENIYATTIDGNNSGTVVQVKTDNFSISGFTIQRSSECGCEQYSGVHVEDYHTNVTVANNLITQNTYGIKIDWSNNTVIANNNIVDNSDGIEILYSSNTSILWNAITNRAIGIELFNSNNNTVMNNIVLNNDIGMYLSFSSGNTISGNTIASSNLMGIIIEQSSSNLVFHCNFVDNLEQADSYNQVNVWDDGFEGNFWSNYTGADLDHDGIGDVPHVLDESNVDNYPLVGMFYSFGASVGYFVDVVSNSTVEGFEYFESNSTITILVSNATVAQSYGFCRLAIPRGLLDAPYVVSVNGSQVPYTPIFESEALSIIYFTYEHSTMEITIIPEHPTTIILPLFLTMMLLVAMLFRKKIETCYKVTKR